MKIRILALTAMAAMLMAPAFGQQTTPADQPAGSSSSQMQSAPADTSQTPATTTDTAQPHQPLTLEQHEGFWGKINPFARKKYVRKQLAPVVGRVNELDELTAANSKMIKDVDGRAQEGIRMASLRANEADQHAVEAGQRAQMAHQTAQQANTRLTSVEQAVTNLDQYQPVTQVEIRFRPGQTALSKKAKGALDQVAEQMKDQHGIILEVQGFSSGSSQAAIANSRDMAQSVVRYLVINHEIPVWRIYTVGMGNAPVKSEDGKARRVRGGRVEVSLMKNAVADLQANAGSASTAPATSEGVSGTMAQPATENAPASNLQQPPAAPQQPAPAQQPQSNENPK